MRRVLEGMLEDNEDGKASMREIFKEMGRDGRWKTALAIDVGGLSTSLSYALGAPGFAVDGVYGFAQVSILEGMYGNDLSGNQKLGLGFIGLVEQLIPVVGDLFPTATLFHYFAAKNRVNWARQERFGLQDGCSMPKRAQRYTQEMRFSGPNAKYHHPFSRPARAQRRHDSYDEMPGIYFDNSDDREVIIPPQRVRPQRQNGLRYRVMQQGQQGLMPYYPSQECMSSRRIIRKNVLDSFGDPWCEAYYDSPAHRIGYFKNGKCLATRIKPMCGGTYFELYDRNGESLGFSGPDGRYLGNDVIAEIDDDEGGLIALCDSRGRRLVDYTNGRNRGFSSPPL